MYEFCACARILVIFLLLGFTSFFSEMANITQTVTQTSMDVNDGLYCGCLYDVDWYIGVVLDRASALSFVWPRHEDQCWVERVNILTMIGRTYNESRGDHDRILRGLNSLGTECNEMRKFLLNFIVVTRVKRNREQTALMDYGNPLI